MALRTENGWYQVGGNQLERIPVPGTSIVIPLQAGIAGRVMRAFVADFHAYVESLYNARGGSDEGGWTPTNSVATSNHLSGTAVDLNWSDHPFRVSYAGFTPAEIATTRELLDWYEGCIFWGQDWNSPKDAMHFQVGYNTHGTGKLEDFARRKIRGDGFSTFRRGGTGVSPSPVTEVVWLGRQYESTGERVRQLQTALNARGASLATDGDFGPATEAAVGAFQRTKGIEVDGIAGPVTLRALGLEFGGVAPVYTVDGVELFRQIMSRTDATNVWLAECLPHYVEAMRAAQINTPLRAAAFASQIGHESSGLKYMAESQTNGPGWTEDRRRYRGRGPIQLTWSSNYAKFGRWCFDNGRVTDPELFVKQPELVERPEWGFLASSWYWLFAGPRPGQINRFADAGDILAVSRCVNGWVEGVDPVGWADRRSRYLNCMTIGDKLMGLSTVSRDPLEELLAMKIPSMSIYRTPGEGPIEGSVMLAALDAHGPHEPYVEEQARKGDPDSLMRVARTASGKGADGDLPKAVKQATDVLLEIAETNRSGVNSALGKV